MIHTERCVLTIEDRESPLWRRLADHMRAQLADLRERNDAPQLDPIKTAAIRGQISQLKSLLALGEPTRKAPEEVVGPED